jgi:hypothetical protein
MDMVLKTPFVRKATSAETAPAAALVGDVDRPRQEDDHQCGLACGLRPVLQLARQRAAFHELQREKRMAVHLADVEDLDDVRMLQPRDRLRFEPETGQLGRPGVAAGQDHFQGDEPVQAALPRLVDDAHAAAA